MGQLKKKKKLLDHVSAANHEYLAFGLWACKWNASVRAQTKAQSRRFNCHLDQEERKKKKEAFGTGHCLGKQFRQ